MRVVAAGAIAFLGSALLWAGSPYNDILIRNQSLAEGYIPAGALLLLVSLILAFNPLVRLLSPRLVLTRRQMALILGLTLVAASPPSAGLMLSLPYMLAKVGAEVRGSSNLQGIYREMNAIHGKMNMTRWLFPDPVGRGGDAFAGDRFQAKLLPGESIPWGAWLAPALTWGSLLMCAYLAMVGMSLILVPQWRKNERLAFPLLTVFGALIEEPKPDRFFPPLFRSKASWILGGAILLILSLNNLGRVFPGAIPAIPMSWNLQRLFTEGVLAQLDTKIHTNTLSFIVIGMAFFMPSRICFSVWFFTLAYAFYEMLHKSFWPPYYTQAAGDLRAGAIVAMAAVIVWLGRAHFLHVFACLFRRCATEDDRRDRFAAAMLLVGSLGMWAWFFAAGVTPGWGIFFTFFILVVSLVITRFVSETGIPFIRLDLNKQMSFLYLAPTSTLNYPTILIGHFVSILFEWGSRCNAAVLATHAFALNSEESPRAQSRLAFLFVVFLCLAFLVSGIAVIHMNYNFDQSLDGVETPLGNWAYQVSGIPQPHFGMIQLKNEAITKDVYNRPLYIGAAAGVTGLLEWASLTMPRWPLHPIGLVMIRTNYARDFWVSLFFGWLLKILVLRYGGARLYRAMFPAIIGVILGELLAKLLWSIVPLLFLAMGIPYLHE